MLMIYKTDGTVQELKPAAKRVCLDELQAAVGGYIEMVTLKNKVIVCNEEGKLMGLPINEKATEIFQESCGTDDFLVGNVIIADKGDIR